MLNADVEAGLGCVRNLLVKEVSGCRRSLLQPECHENRILPGADRDVHVSTPENKKVELPLMILLQRKGVVY